MKPLLEIEKQKKDGTRINYGTNINAGLLSAFVAITVAGPNV
jgi:hypothetical protein